MPKNHRLFTTLFCWGSALTLTVPLATSVIAQVQETHRATKQTNPAAWATRLAALNDDWRQSFAVGNEIAALPPDDGYEILRTNWHLFKQDSPKQQIIKAIYFAGRSGQNKRLLDVLHLAATDASPQVQNWALGYLKDVALQDFFEDYPAYLRWYKANHDRSLTDIQADALVNIANTIRKGDAKQEQMVAHFLADSHLGQIQVDRNTLRAVGTKAGLLDISEQWIATKSAAKSSDANRYAEERLKAAMALIGFLQPGVEWQQRVFLPYLTEESSDEQSIILPRLSELKATWMVKPLLKLLEYDAWHLDRASSVDRLMPVAELLGDIGDVRAVPVMIGVIAAEDTSKTRYKVGYFGLSPITGVSYDEDHTGAWWKAWWEKNKERFPQTVRATPIPVYGTRTGN